MCLNLIVPGCVSDVVIGDGLGSHEERLTDTETFAECVDLVKIQRPEANGVSYGRAEDTQKHCYAEFNQASQNEDDRWGNCFIDPSVGPDCTATKQELDVWTHIDDIAYMFLDEEGFCPVDGSKTLQFCVRAKSDIHLALRDNKSNKDTIEIVLGGWGDTNSAIRSEQDGTPVAEAPGARLDANSYKPFWVTWSDEGDIEVGEGSISGLNKFMSASVPQNVHYVGIHTGFGADGDWSFGHGGQCPTYEGGV